MQVDPFEDVPMDEYGNKNKEKDIHDEYKRIIGNAIAQSWTVANQKAWVIVEPLDPVTFYEQPVDEKGFYAFKVSGIVQGRADRYFYVLCDHQTCTRGQWDKDDVLDDMEQYETYHSDEGKITVVCSTIKSPVPRLVAHRRLFGVRWAEFVKEHNRYTIVFQTCQHPTIRCPEDGRVDANALIRADIDLLDSPGQCSLTLTVRINLSGNAFGLGFLGESLQGATQTASQTV